MVELGISFIYAPACTCMHVCYICSSIFDFDFKVVHAVHVRLYVQTYVCLRIFVFVNIYFCMCVRNMISCRHVCVRVLFIVSRTYMCVRVCVCLCIYSLKGQYICLDLPCLSKFMSCTYLCYFYICL